MPHQSLAALKRFVVEHGGGNAVLAGKHEPFGIGLLLTTAAMRTPYARSHCSCCAVFTMAAMLEPPPEIKITMFFICP